ncbi:unnamed protein product [Pedinophyceae sp. YPF-701]|nr:unnamed protein product [Pedinophyceae sp. YPF-701]
MPGRSHGVPAALRAVLCALACLCALPFARAQATTPPATTPVETTVPLATTQPPSGFTVPPTNCGPHNFCPVGSVYVGVSDSASRCFGLRTIEGLELGCLKRKIDSDVACTCCEPWFGAGCALTGVVQVTSPARDATPSPQRVGTCPVSEPEGRCSEVPTLALDRTLTSIGVINARLSFGRRMVATAATNSNATLEFPGLFGNPSIIERVSDFFYTTVDPATRVAVTRRADTFPELARGPEEFDEFGFTIRFRQNTPGVTSLLLPPGSFREPPAPGIRNPELGSVRYSHGSLSEGLEYDNRGPNVVITTDASVVAGVTTEDTVKLQAEVSQACFGWDWSKVEVAGGRVALASPLLRNELDGAASFSLSVTFDRRGGTISVVIPAGQCRSASGLISQRAETSVRNSPRWSRNAAVAGTTAAATAVGTAVASSIIAGSVGSSMSGGMATGGAAGAMGAQAGSAAGTASPAAMANTVQASTVALLGHVQFFSLFGGMQTPMPEGFRSFAEGLRWTQLALKAPWAKSDDAGAEALQGTTQPGRRGAQEQGALWTQEAAEIKDAVDDLLEDPWNLVIVTMAYAALVVVAVAIIRAIALAIYTRIQVKKLIRMAPEPEPEPVEEGEAAEEGEAPRKRALLPAPTHMRREKEIAQTLLLMEQAHAERAAKQRKIRAERERALSLRRRTVQETEGDTPQAVVFRKAPSWLLFPKPEIMTYAITTAGVASAGARLAAEGGWVEIVVGTAIVLVWCGAFFFAIWWFVMRRGVLARGADAMVGYHEDTTPDGMKVSYTRSYIIPGEWRDTTDGARVRFHDRFGLVYNNSAGPSVAEVELEVYWHTRGAVDAQARNATGRARSKEQARERQRARDEEEPLAARWLSTRLAWLFGSYPYALRVNWWMLDRMRVVLVAVLSGLTFIDGSTGDLTDPGKTPGATTAVAVALGVQGLVGLFLCVFAPMADVAEFSVEMLSNIVEVLIAAITVASTQKPSLADSDELEYLLVALSIVTIGAHMLFQVYMIISVLLFKRFLDQQRVKKRKKRGGGQGYVQNVHRQYLKDQDEYRPPNIVTGDNTHWYQS